MKTIPSALQLPEAGKFREQKNGNAARRNF